MKIKPFLYFFAILMTPLALFQAYGPSRSSIVGKDFESYLESLVETSGGVGISVGVVKNGALVYSRGFGYRDLEKKLPVTPRTVFALGSVSKSFTASLGAILVDRKLFDFDTRIKDIIPEFGLRDLASTESLSFRHLLSHQSGLPRHDMFWVLNSGLTESNLLQTLARLEPMLGTGQTFLYNNLMYALAGVVEEKVTGKKWADLMREEIFRPLHMSHTSVTHEAMIQEKEYALPYLINSEGKIELTELWPGLDLVGPAGSINSNIEDMSQYILFHLNRGIGSSGSRLLSEKSFGELHKDTVEIPSTAFEYQFLREDADPESKFYYQLGWFSSKRDGLPLYKHVGGASGQVSDLIIHPSKGLGLVVLANNESFPVSDLSVDLLDYLTDKPLRHLALKKLNKFLTSLKTKSDSQSQCPRDLSPEEEAQILGTYFHPAYGTFRIFKSKNSLNLEVYSKVLNLVRSDEKVWTPNSKSMALKLIYGFEWDNLRQELVFSSSPMDSSSPKIRFKKISTGSHENKKISRSS